MSYIFLASLWSLWVLFLFGYSEISCFQALLMASILICTHIDHSFSGGQVLIVYTYIRIQVADNYRSICIYMNTCSEKRWALSKLTDIPDWRTIKSRLVNDVQHSNQRIITRIKCTNVGGGVVGVDTIGRPPSPPPRPSLPKSWQELLSSWTGISQGLFSKTGRKQARGVGFLVIMRFTFIEAFLGNNDRPTNHPTDDCLTARPTNKRKWGFSGNLCFQ